MFGKRSFLAPLNDSLSKLGRLPTVRAASKASKWLAEAGTAGYDPETKRRLMIMNFIAYLIAVTTLVYAVQHIFLDFEKYKLLIYINLALVATAIVIPLSHRINEMAGGMVLLISEYVALFVITKILGTDSGIHIQYFIVAAATFVVFGLERWRLIIPLIVIATILHLYAQARYPTENALIETDPAMLWSIYTQAAITTMALIAACVFYSFSLVESAKEETDKLLRNILPDKIAERLKEKPGEAIADSFDDASILFADITGFVAMAREMGAAQVVDILNNLVSQFDALAAQHGVEKIKTIGDAYMVASGIPEPTHDHLERLARMGHDMLATVAKVREETGLPLNMRVGIATGPVMAGVIGTRKFTYDVWGDAVNLAARLENKSQPGRILICSSCHETLQHLFKFEPRGAIEIKGVGMQNTWYLGQER
ncbi:MAG: adenylate/guanylate cyclase domain-containing protein [Hyphomicrobiaceae bacterium]